MASTVLTWIDRLPSPAIASRALTARLTKARFELRDVGGGKTRTIAKIELDLNSAAHQRADQLRDAFDLRADIEHLRRQRLAAGKSQKLAGQFRRAIDRVRNRIDVTAAPIFAQLAAAQEIGGGADDRREVVEIVSDAAGQLADRIHLLGLAKRFFGLPPFGDVDRFGQDAGDDAVLIEDRDAS